MAYTDRNLSNLTISESFWRLMQTDPVDDKTLLDGTGSLVTYLAVSGTVDAYYFKGDGSQLTNLPVSIPAGTVSSSAQTIGNLSGTNIVSGSGQRSVLGLGTTDSPTFGGLTVTGTLTAKEFHTQLVSASIIFQSGSTKFGDTLDDTHQFTGSVLVTGSVRATSFVGDGSGLTGIVNTLPSGLISGSQQITNFGFVSSSQWNDILNKPSGLVSSSAQTISNLNGTNIVSGSGQRSILGLGESDSPRFGNIYSTNGNFDGNVVVGGTLTARTYVVSSSVVDYQTIQVSGSSKFGDTFDDTHQFTGSLLVTGSVTSNFFIGDGRNLTNVTASFPTVNIGDIAPPSTQTKFFINDDPSGSASGNKNITYKSLLQDIAGTGLVVNDSDDSVRVDPNLSGLDSVQATSFTVSLSGTASFALTASYALNAAGFESGSFATTASNIFYGNQTINGDLIITGSLTAQQYIVSSSVLYVTQSFSSGSTMFGDSLDDTHRFTGSLYITGALVIPTVQTLSPTADVGTIVINSNNLYIYF